VVPDGWQVIEACRTVRYDLILMDCHMPVMDGFDATAAIRRRSAPGATPDDVPIVAVTASAMAEDRQRCQAVGMNDVLAKPFAVDALAAMLDLWIPHCHRAGEGMSAEPGASGAGPEAAPKSPREAIRAMLASMAADTDVSVAVAAGEAFVKDIPRAVAAIRVALASQDPGRLAAAVHYLKSSAAQVGLSVVSTLCRQLEQRSKLGDLAQAAERVQGIEQALAEGGRVLEEEIVRLATVGAASVA